MGQLNYINVSNKNETSLKAVQSNGFAYRFAYARSKDSQKENEPGQDILVCVEDGNRIAFALCDGVSQSFFGDLAARNLADGLVKWLWKQNDFNEELLRSSLATQLQDLTGPTQLKVAKYPLPAEISPLVRSVLEQKRNDVGSESMFVAGLVDTDKKRALFAWLGDSRLRIWDPNLREQTGLFGDSFTSHERWYSNKGAVGVLHLQTFPLEKISQIAAYSDGLACLDLILNLNMQNQQIQSSVNSNGADDDSFIQISMGQMPKEWGAPVTPARRVAAPAVPQRGVVAPPVPSVSPLVVQPTPLQHPAPFRRRQSSRFFYFLVGVCLVLVIAISLVAVKINTLLHEKATKTPTVEMSAKQTGTGLPLEIFTSAPNTEITSTEPAASQPKVTPQPIQFFQKDE